MKNILRYGILLTLLIALIFGLGPVVELDQTIKPVKLPSDINIYLSNREKQIPDIIPGTEKTIVWAHPSQREKTDYSIVYLHGFSASRQDVTPLCELISKHFAANVFYARLTGHGRDGTAMKSLTVNALLNDGFEALQIGQAIGKHVIIIGTSTGGTLATWLASLKLQPRIFALILLSPNFGPKRAESELMLLPWGNVMLRLVEGDTYRFEPRNPAQKRYWTTQYPSQALLPMMGLVEVARLSTLKGISVPAFVLYDENDKIVDVSKTKKYVARFSSPKTQLVAFSGSGDPQHHILAGDILSPHTTAQIAIQIENFVDSLK